MVFSSVIQAGDAVINVEVEAAPDIETGRIRLHVK